MNDCKEQVFWCKSCGSVSACSQAAIPRLAICLPVTPAGLSEIVPHWYFERSQIFFRSAAKVQDVGRRTADTLKLKAVPNRTSTT